MRWDEDAFSSGGDKADKLIVIIHGLWGTARQLSSVAETAVSALGACDVYMPDMAYGGKTGTLSSIPPATIVCELLEAVDALELHRDNLKRGPYKKIFILGYSMGALIARKLAVVAHGEFDEAPFEPGYFEPGYEDYREARDWAGRIDRVVLLGGVSRGWSPRSAGNWLNSTFWSLCILLAMILPARRGMIMETRFGLPFPVQTRLQWLALSRAGQRVARRSG